MESGRKHHAPGRHVPACGRAEKVQGRPFGRAVWIETAPTLGIAWNSHHSAPGGWSWPRATRQGSKLLGISRAAAVRQSTAGLMGRSRSA